MQTTYPKINMKLELPPKEIFYQFDNFQITQAFTNIIKNAIESCANNTQSFNFSKIN